MRLKLRITARKLVQVVEGVWVCMKLSKRQINRIWWVMGWSVWRVQDVDLEVYGLGRHEIKNTGRGTLFSPYSLWWFIFSAKWPFWLVLGTETIFSWWSSFLGRGVQIMPPTLLQWIAGDLGLANQSIICHTYYVQVWAHDPS